ncbi:MAG: hypothetical protein GXP43_01515, partial [bacterium]|nr:hypothetical protein [bacterium]
MSAQEVRQNCLSLHQLAKQYCRERKEIFPERPPWNILETYVKRSYYDQIRKELRDAKNLKKFLEEITCWAICWTEVVLVKDDFVEESDLVLSKKRHVEMIYYLGQACINDYYKFEVGLTLVLLALKLKGDFQFHIPQIPPANKLAAELIKKFPKKADFIQKVINDQADLAITERISKTDSWVIQRQANGSNSDIEW